MIVENSAHLSHITRQDAATCNPFPLVYSLCILCAGPSSMLTRVAHTKHVQGSSSLAPSSRTRANYDLSDENVCQKMMSSE